MKLVWIGYWFVIAFAVSGALLCGGVVVGRVVGLHAHTGAHTCVVSAWVFDTETGKEISADVLKNKVLLVSWKAE